MNVRVTADDVINTAMQYVGTKEVEGEENNIIFNTHYYGKPVRGMAYPWRMTFVWDIFRLSNASNLFFGGSKTANVEQLRRNFEYMKRMHKTPQRGDLAFFQFSGNKVATHVGFVADVLDKFHIRTIEGQSSTIENTFGNSVMLRTRDTKNICGYGRPSYAPSEVSERLVNKPKTSFDSWKEMLTERYGISFYEYEEEDLYTMLKEKITEEDVDLLSIDDIKIAQISLMLNHLYKGPITGIYSKETIDSVKSLQQILHKDVNGCIDVEIWAWLILRMFYPNKK